MDFEPGWAVLAGLIGGGVMEQRRSGNLSERLGPFQALLPSSSHLFGSRMEEKGKGGVTKGVRDDESNW